MKKVGGVVQSKGGRVVVGAVVRAFLTGTATPATMYSDAQGQRVIKDGDLKSDNEGEYEFYVANGRYDVKEYVQGRLDGQYLDVLVYDPGDIRLDSGSLVGNPGWDDIPMLGDYTPLNAQSQALLNRFALLDSSQGASRVQTIQIGAGAVARSIQDKLRESVSVKDFGAIGDGVANDTAAIQAATVAVGNAGVVRFPPGQYKTMASITAGKNVVMQGAGPKTSIIVPVGNFDVFAFAGPSEGAGVRDLGVVASAMTGGEVVSFTNSDRGSVSNVIITSPFNGIYATKVNVLSLREVWVNGIRGEFGVQIYGDATNRSDVIDIDNVIQSCSDNAVGATGILIDGNVHTVDIRHAACTKMGRGLWVKNTSGALNPAFVTGYDIQVDFPLNEAVRLEGSARTILLTDLYAHGSVQSDGIYIDESVQNVSIQGGQCDSNYKRGIFAGGRYIKVSSQQVSNNSAQGSATWPGIEIGAASVGVSIVGNLSGQWLGYAANLQSYGVQIAAGAQSYVVTANNLRLNVTGELLDAANSADSVVAGNTTTLGKYAFSRGICSYSGDFPISAQAGGRMVLANGNGTHLEVGGATANVVNRIRIAGDAAGGVPKILAEGSDTNLDIQLLTKGSGVPRFGAYSSSSDAAVTGYITIKDASGTLRKLAVIS